MPEGRAIDRYMGRIKDYLRTDSPRIEEKDWGYVAIKGNWRPSKGTESLVLLGRDTEKSLLLDSGEVLHERVMLIERDIPIRSHEEVRQEVIVNIGDSNVWLPVPNDPRYGYHERWIPPGQVAESVWVYGPDQRPGFYHGFKVNKGEEGLVYVAKALHPEFADGDSFRVPENTYREKQS